MTAFDAIGNHVLPTKTWNPVMAAPAQVIDYIDLSAIDSDSKQIYDVKQVLGKDAPSRARQLVKVADVLVSTVRPNLNGLAVVPENLDGATASTGFTVLRANETSLAARYLYHWLKTPEFISDMVRKATGQSYPAVSDRIVTESLMPMPMIEEQRRIAAILDQAEALRAKRRQALAKLDTLTQSLFLEMFGDPRSNPKGWKLEYLENVGEVAGGLQLTPKRKQYDISKPYLRVANVYRDRLELSEVKYMGLIPAEFVRTQLRDGDLLIVEGHGNPEEIGRCAVWQGQITDCVHQNHLIRVRLNQRVIDPTFVSTYLNSANGREQVLRAGKTTSGLNTLSTSNVKKFRIYLPPISAQKKFEASVNKFRKLVESAAEHSSALENMTASLQHRAFRGEL